MKAIAKEKARLTREIKQQKEFVDDLMQMQKKQKGSRVFYYLGEVYTDVCLKREIIYLLRMEQLRESMNTK
jgi:hypothetical protein